MARLKNGTEKSIVWKPKTDDDVDLGGVSVSVPAEGELLLFIDDKFMG